MTAKDKINKIIIDHSKKFNKRLDDVLVSIYYSNDDTEAVLFIHYIEEIGGNEFTSDFDVKPIPIDKDGDVCKYFLYESKRYNESVNDVYVGLYSANSNELVMYVEEMDNYEQMYLKMLEN